MTLSLIRTKACKWLLLTFCLVASASGYAGVNGSDTLTASKVFAEIPLDVLDMLRPSMRLDMLDYYSQADSILTVQDALGGQSRLEQLTPDYIKVSVTPISTLEIKILKSGKKQIVMTLYTVGGVGAAKDTDIRFFDALLRPLDKSKFIKAPGLLDFFDLKDLKEKQLTKAELIEKIPFAAVAYSTGPGEAPLSATLTTLDVISEGDRELLTPLLSPTLSAIWKGKYRFN